MAHGSDIQLKGGSEIRPNTFWQEVYYKGVKVRNDIVYRDPRTGKESRIRDVAGDPLSEEQVQQRLSSGADTTYSVRNEEFTYLDPAIQQGKAREHYEKKYVQAAKEVGVPTYQRQRVFEEYGKKVQRERTAAVNKAIAEAQLQAEARQQIAERRQKPTTFGEFYSSLRERQLKSQEKQRGGERQVTYSYIGGGKEAYVIAPQEAKVNIFQARLLTQRPDKSRNIVELTEYPYGRDFQKVPTSVYSYSIAKKENFFEENRRKFETYIEERKKTSEEVSKYIRQQERLGKGTHLGRLQEAQATITYVELSALKGFATPFLRPISTAKGIVNLVKDTGKSYFYTLKSRKSGDVGFSFNTKGSLKELGVDFSNRPLGAVSEFAGGALAFKFIGFGVGRVKNLLPLERLSPKYIPYEESGVLIESGVTIPTKLNKLLKFEEKTVDTVHASYANLPEGTYIKPAELKNIDAGRAAIGQRNFYSSSPVFMTIEKLATSRYAPVRFVGRLSVGTLRGTGELVKFLKTKALELRLDYSFVSRRVGLFGETGKYYVSRAFENINKPIRYISEKAEPIIFKTKLEANYLGRRVGLFGETGKYYVSRAGVYAGRGAEYVSNLTKDLALRTKLSVYGGTRTGSLYIKGFGYSFTPFTERFGSLYRGTRSSLKTTGLGLRLTGEYIGRRVGLTVGRGGYYFSRAGVYAGRGAEYVSNLTKDLTLKTRLGAYSLARTTSLYGKGFGYSVESATRPVIRGFSNIYTSVKGGIKTTGLGIRLTGETISRRVGLVGETGRYYVSRVGVYAGRGIEKVSIFSKDVALKTRLGAYGVARNVSLYGKGVGYSIARAGEIIGRPFKTRLTALEKGYKTTALKFGFEKQYLSRQAGLLARQAIYKYQPFYIYKKVVPKIIKENPRYESVSIAKTPLTPRYTPVVYGGYIGIGEGYSGLSQTRFSLLPQRGKAYIFEDTFISKTPEFIKRKPIRELVDYQTTRAGTYVAAENIKGRSIEGQFTTSAGYEGQPLIRIIEAGGELEGSFTSYKLRKPVPELLGGEKANVIVKKAWDLLTTEKKYVEFRTRRFEKVAETVKGKEALDTLRELPESENVRYISASSSLKNTYPFSSLRSSLSSTSRSFISSSIKSSSSVSQSVSSSLSSLSSSVSKASSRSSSSSVRSSLSSLSSSLSLSSSISSSYSSLSSYISSISSRSSSSSSRSYLYTPPPPPTTTIPQFTPKGEGFKISKAFDVYVKRFGEYKKVSSGLPYGKALKSLTFNLQETLAASGKLVEAGTTSLKDISFKAGKQFRSYRIVKGKKVPTPLELIQRRGFRLSSQREVSEITKFRNLKVR